jgi:hypothetical protein
MCSDAGVAIKTFYDGPHHAKDESLPLNVRNQSWAAKGYLLEKRISW